LNSLRLLGQAVPHINDMLRHYRKGEIAIPVANSFENFSVSLYHVLENIS